jgi:hypothetical protein
LLSAGYGKGENQNGKNGAGKTVQFGHRRQKSPEGIGYSTGAGVWEDQPPGEREGYDSMNARTVNSAAGIHFLIPLALCQHPRHL